MTKISTVVRSLALAVPFILGTSWTALAVDKVSFNRDIRPILADKCFACHGTDPKKREADLRLDQKESAYRDNEGTIALVPGDLKKSEAWLRIQSTDEDEVMPPPKSHKSLTAHEKALIQKWIEQGAVYEKHWAFEPPVKVEAPVRAGIRNPVDAFILTRLEKEKLAPSPEADKITLVRRATLAITGLPPTTKEVDAFVADATPEAYEKLVDRLLMSPRYGEHMAHWWLDLARFGDTHGMHLDNERQIWLYRDWVIGAFNRNLPFDQFTVEQIAGDQLPNATNDQIVATGFNRSNVTSGEGGSIDAEYIFRYAIDRTATTTQTWLGLTAQCAVCHDHKFDPLSQKEMYQLYAFFNNSADPAMDGNLLLTAPVLQYATPEQKKQLADFDVKIAAVKKKLTEAVAVAALAYKDPADQPATAGPRKTEEVWMDDSFPTGALPAIRATAFVGAPEVAPAAGKFALKGKAKGLAQDYYESGAKPLIVPAQGVISIMARVDPQDLPKAIMIQFHGAAQWKHRAVWGDHLAIDFGKVGTSERFHAGPLPQAGNWVQLDVPVEKMGLKPGDQVTGYALTQFDGTVYWDKMVARGVDDPANDPSLSFAAWLKSNEGKSIKGAPAEINAVIKKAAAQRKPEELKPLREYFVQNVGKATRVAFDPIEKEVAELEKQKKASNDAIPSTFVMRDRDNARDSFIMDRGDYTKPKEKVEPAVPAVFPAMLKDPKTGRANRLDLAKWMVDARNPLTSRVAVNRFWQHFFGIGLVKTSGDFGSQGEAPSNPELLDWLAIRFRESGWDMKRLIKTLVTSSTFKQSSRVTPELLQRDPENRLLARGPRVRLNAEAIRDDALFVSGLLVEKMGGKSVRSYQPPNIWEPVGFVGSNTSSYKQDHGEALYRRSIYSFLKRTAPPPYLVNFDAPSREDFCTKRERSDTPLQALQLLNDVQFFEAARNFAQRILTEGGATPEARLAHAFRVTLARKPEPKELETVRALLDSLTAKYKADAAAAKAVITNGESKPNEKLDPAELAAWTQVANLLLNLDENVSIN